MQQKQFNVEELLQIFS